MSWSEKMKEFGSGGMVFLSEDGDTVKFMVVGLPELFEGSYKGQDTRKIGVPVVTEEGLVILVAGMRLARKLTRQEKRFANTVFLVTRNGEEGDSSATYPLEIVDDDKLLHTLKDIAKVAVTPETLEAAFKVARAVCEKE
jgi:hypothetical protein